MVGPVADGQETLGFGTRIWFAWVCFFKVLFDGLFAGRVWDVSRGAIPALPGKEPAKLPEPEEPVVVEAKPAPKPEPAPPSPPSVDAALQLLALLQREGRLVDFLEEDVTSFSDADVGAAARVVHQGCKKALHDHAKVVPVRRDEEGTKVTVAKGTPPHEVKLIGNVAGEPPFTGVLRHRGWRVEDLHLPTAIHVGDGGHDLRVIAPAEVEL